ncbi:MAG: MBL fold metallo-hydrolase [Candidatus Altiarchaeota archaeon]|nr:MBL fold metallo-hydrolase [Candidatus Altiarchaeota archaeon]MBU4437489.1 MBL fold metallo-hydrolase [Candidatus Altiarchaeota archaeon]
MVSLTFHGGVNEIGGSKILLEDKDTRIFLDFGQSFDFGQDYFTGWLAARGRNGLGDYFEFDLLPKIEGLYSQEQLEGTEMDHCEPEIDAIFLSHAHFDHMAHISFVDERIPVHCGEATLRFIKAQETSGLSKFGEHDYRTFKTGDKIGVGSLELEPIHVDHSIPGAYGYVIHTSEGAVVYTGDLRMHGPMASMTQEFIRKAKESKPVAMITEGTRMAPEEKRRNYSEQQVCDICDKIVSGTDKLVVMTHYGRDIDRFMTFYNLCKKTGKKFVILPKIAHLLKELHNDKNLKMPDPLKDDNLLVYFKRKKVYYKWEKEFMPKKVDADYVHENQGDILMYLNFYQFGELIDIRPARGSHFIHSMSEPFSEEDIEDEVMHRWLDHFGFEFHQAHASGHASKEELVEMIKEIGPKRIFPVHTEHPEMFRERFSNAEMVEKGKRYGLE